MSDIAITAASVLKGSNAVTVLGTLGATVTQGQVVYLDSATNTWKLADNDSGTAAARIPSGVCLTSGVSGQPCVVQTSGDITIGGTLTAGIAYYLSATAGGICPVADVTSTHNAVVLGIAKSTTVLGLNIQNSGVTL